MLTSCTGTFPVTSYGNLGNCTLSFTIGGVAQTPRCQISVTGLTREQAIAAAGAYVDGLRASISLLLTTLRTAALSMVVAIGLVGLIGLPITLAGVAILAVSTLFVVLFTVMIYSVENAQSPLMRSIRAQYPSSRGA